MTTEYTGSSKAFAAFIAERNRQVLQENWSPEHDDEHVDGELAGAAACYARHGTTYKAASSDLPAWAEDVRRDVQSEMALSREAVRQHRERNPRGPMGWPWELSWWKPSSRKRDIEKAVALLAAEWERLDRLENKSNGQAVSNLQFAEQAGTADHQQDLSTKAEPMTAHVGRRKLYGIIENLASVTRGPWKVFTGSSWRRIGRDGQHIDDLAVIAPTTARDGHPDLTVSRGNDRDANLDHIARCDPDTFEQIADYVRGLERRLETVDRVLGRYDQSVTDFAPFVKVIRAEIAAGEHRA